MNMNRLLSFEEGPLSSEAWKEPVERAKQLAYSHGPTILGGLAILLGGWVVALVARGLIERMLRAARLNQAIEGTRIGSIVGAFGKEWTASKIVAQLVYLTLVLLTLNTTAGHFGLSGLQSALSGAMAYLPKALSALALIAGGAYVGGLAKKSVGSVLRELRNPAAGLLESLTEGGILLVAALVAFDVLGADLTFITSNLTMLLGGLLVIVAFLGCWAMRMPAEHLVANYYLRRMLSVGDHVQTKVHDGTVLEFQPLGVILRDAKGDEHFVPARDLISGLRRRQGLNAD